MGSSVGNDVPKTLARCSENGSVRCSVLPNERPGIREAERARHLGGSGALPVSLAAGLGCGRRCCGSLPHWGGGPGPRFALSHLAKTRRRPPVRRAHLPMLAATDLW